MDLLKRPEGAHSKDIPSTQDSLMIGVSVNRELVGTVGFEPGIATTFATTFATAPSTHSARGTFLAMNY